MRIFAVYCLLLAVLLGAAVAQSNRRVEGPFPARPGEICVICYGVLNNTGLAYLIDGRRYGVDASESGEFLQDPESHIRKFEAHQAADQRQGLLAPIAAAVLAVATLLFVWLRRRRRA
ncbi:MAG TPA: hypothetical protein VGK29_00415 [Paludibaculum sp.]|jgi:hypothetical protein